MSDWGRLRFRAWLLGKVLENQNLARGCCVAVHNKRVEEVAAQSGLHATVVEEAGREFARRVVSAGRPVPTGPRTSNLLYPQISVPMPAVINDAWMAHAERLHLKPTLAIRSMLHGYLLGAEEPHHRDRRWVLDGKLVEGPVVKRWEPAITGGAMAALETRAAKLGLAPRELVRCLLVDVLAGRRRVGTPNPRAAVLDDPKRYRQ